MTEAEWLVCEDAQAMRMSLRNLPGGVWVSAGRRTALFGCASCRDHWNDLVDPRSRAAVEKVEFVIDGGTGVNWEQVQEDARQALSAVERTWHGSVTTAGDHPHRLAQTRAAAAVHCLVSQSFPHGCASADEAMRSFVGEGNVEEHRAWRARLRVLAGYLRDIFGNPFRPVTFPKSWRTEHTVGLASKMYDERDFAAMPILADALEEAGCDNADILAHCREPGVHVRGCWVVDLVLGKV